MKKLSESIWSDMQDRSAGETVRKEDDISLLDNEGLYDYIKSKYESRIPNFNVDMGYYTNKSSNEKHLLIQPYGRWKPLMLYVFYNDGKIGEICTHFDKFKRWNFNILKQKYLLIPDRHYDECNYNFKISEKDGTITNHTVIGIIDILVEDKSKILLESIWSDMQDRSTGEVVRKEDENMEGLKKYLETHYELIDPYKEFQMLSYNRIYTSVGICAFAYKNEDGSLFLFWLNLKDDDGKYTLTINKTAQKYNIFDLLKKEYIVKDAKTWEYIIIPKNKKTDRKFFFEVLTFILSHVEYPEISIIRKIEP